MDTRKTNDVIYCMAPTEIEVAKRFMLEHKDHTAPQKSWWRRLFQRKSKDNTPKEGFVYELNTTAIGYGWNIRCLACGAVKDITDYSLW